MAAQMKLLSSRMDGGPRGFSLVELMIAMVLGLILLGGVIAAFVSATGSLAVNREMDRSQESLRFVVTLLTDEIRQAMRPGTGTYTIPIEVSPDGPDVSQEITIRYRVFNTGEAVHCDGHPVTVPEADAPPILEKTFSVDGDALVCVSNDSNDGSVTRTANLAFGLRRIRIEEWLESRTATDAAYTGYELLSPPRQFMSDLAEEDGLGLVGVRLLVEHDHVGDESQTFVVSVALRNSILQWFRKDVNT